MKTGEVRSVEADARASGGDGPRATALRRRRRGATKGTGRLAAIVIGGGLVISACGPGVKRDLSGVPVGQVGFDDLCGLQSYYDTLAIKEATPPAVIDAADIERISAGSTALGGRARFAFETDFQLTTVKRVLEENWKGLPPGLSAAKHIELNVTWSARAGLRRVANNSSPELVMDGTTVTIPYHVCLSELLFGEKIYDRRREVLGLPPLATAHALAVGPDGGAPSAPGGADGPVAPANPLRSASADAGTPPPPAPAQPASPRPGAAAPAGTGSVGRK